MTQRDCKIGIFMNLPEMAHFDSIASRLEWIKRELIQVSLDACEKILGEVKAQDAEANAADLSYQHQLMRDAEVIRYALETAAMVACDEADHYKLVLSVKAEHIDFSNPSVHAIAAQLDELVVSELRICAHVRVALRGCVKPATEADRELLVAFNNELDLTERDDTCLIYHERTNEYCYAVPPEKNAQERMFAFLGGAQ